MHVHSTGLSSFTFPAYRTMSLDASSSFIVGLKGMVGTSVIQTKIWWQSFDWKMQGGAAAKMSVSVLERPDVHMEKQLLTVHFSPQSAACSCKCLRQFGRHCLKANLLTTMKESGKIMLKNNFVRSFKTSFTV